MNLRAKMIPVRFLNKYNIEFSEQVDNTVSVINQTCKTVEKDLIVMLEFPEIHMHVSSQNECHNYVNPFTSMIVC